MDAAQSADLTGLERLERRMRGEADGSPMVQLLGLSGRILGPGEVAFAGTPTAEHLNAGGTVHGGYAATLLDTAMGCAAQSVVGAGQNVVTMDLKVSYHRAMTGETGRVEAMGRILSRGRRAVFAEGKLVDANGRLLASGSATLLIVVR